MKEILAKLKKLEEDSSIFSKEKDKIEELKNKYPHGVQIEQYWNAIEWVGDKAYRLRADCLIVDSKLNIFILKTTKKTKWANPLKYYRVPGGSFEKDLTIKQLAVHECMEEAGFRFNEDDVIETGISYIVEFDWKKDEILSDIYKRTGIKMSGGKTHIVICRYSGILDITRLEKEDNDIYNYGDFFPVSEVKDILFPEHLEALIQYTKLPLDQILTEETLILNELELILEEIRPVNDDDDETLEERIERFSKETTLNLEDEFRDSPIADSKLQYNSPILVESIGCDIIEENIADECSSLKILKESGHLDEYKYKIFKKIFLEYFNYNLDNFQVDLTAEDFNGKYKPEMPITNFDIWMIQEGMIYEREHTDNVPLRLKITLDHLVENPEYYLYLKSVGLYPIIFTEGYPKEIETKYPDPMFHMVTRNSQDDPQIVGNSKISDKVINGFIEKIRERILKKYNYDISNFKRTINNGIDDYLKHSFAKFGHSSPDQLMDGIEIEAEHYPEISKRIEIALDHLTYNPVYYLRLKEAEEKFEKKELKEKKEIIYNDVESQRKFLTEIFNNPEILDENSTDLQTIFGIQEKLKIIDYNKFYNEILKDKLNSKYLYIYFTNSAGVLANITRIVTRDPYNHVGICFDDKLETMLSFDIRGRGLVYQHPLVSFNKNTFFELYRIKITPEKLQKVLKFVEDVSKSNSYNFEALVKSYLLGFKTNYKNKKGMYEFTCSTFVFFILNLVEIDFLLKDKLEPSKVTPYDILKYIKKDEIKFIAEGKLHDYYYQIKGIEHDDSIIRYSFSSEKTEKQSISILNDKVRIFPMYNEERKSIVTEDGKFNNKVNIEDLKDHKGVSGVIRNKKNQILLLYHNKFNGWTLPMGKVKNGENLYDALCSELNEELGIDVVSATEITNFEKSYVTNGAVQKIDHHIFEINLFNGSPKNLEKTKHKNMIWLSYDNIITLKNKLDPLKALVNKLGGSNIYYNLNESGKPFILYETPITEKEKENLPDSDFGYKDKSGKRHFPLHDANHVRSAISMFHYCPKKYKKVLARKIKEKANKFGIKIENEKLLSENAGLSEFNDIPYDTNDIDRNNSLSDRHRFAEISIHVNFSNYPDLLKSIENFKKLCRKDKEMIQFVENSSVLQDFESLTSVPLISIGVRLTSVFNEDLNNILDDFKTYLFMNPLNIKRIYARVLPFTKIFGRTQGDITSASCFANLNSDSIEYLIKYLKDKYIILSSEFPNCFSYLKNNIMIKVGEQTFPAEKAETLEQFSFEDEFTGTNLDITDSLVYKVTMREY